MTLTPIFCGDGKVQDLKHRLFFQKQSQAGMNKGNVMKLLVGEKRPLIPSQDEIHLSTLLRSQIFLALVQVTLSSQQGQGYSLKNEVMK